MSKTTIKNEPNLKGYRGLATRYKRSDGTVLIIMGDDFISIRDAVLQLSDDTLKIEKRFCEKAIIIHNTKI